MQAAIDRVLQTYGLMVNLTAEEEQATRRRLEKHLAGMQADDNALAVRAFAICADQTVLRGEEWRGKQHDGLSDQEGSA